MEPTRLRTLIAKLLQRAPHLSPEEIKQRFDRSPLPAADRPTLVEIRDAITLEEIGSKKHDFTRVQIPDQKDQSGVASEKVPINLTKIIIICPGCGNHSEMKSQSTAKRPRKQCSHCGKKFDLKNWIPQKSGPSKNQKDQSGVASEKVPRTPYQIPLSQVENKVFESLKQGFFASTIAATLNLSHSTIHRIIQRLISKKYIEPVGGYPKIYKIHNPDDSKDQSGVVSEKVPKWPTTSDIHCIRFKVPITRFGKTTGARENKKIRNWVKYTFDSRYDLSVPMDWKVEINTQHAVFNYTPGITKSKHLQKDIEALKQTLPFAFLEQKGFMLDRPRTDLAQKPHCVIHTGTKLDVVGTQMIVAVQKNGEDIYHQDDSQEKGGEMETDAERGDALLDVPYQIERLQTQLNQLTQTITTYTQQFTQILQTILPKAPQPSVAPVADIYQ